MIGIYYMKQLKNSGMSPSKLQRCLVNLGNEANGHIRSVLPEDKGKIAG